MPTFTFTSPDGKKYDVQGPEGATKEQAFGILQQRLGSGGAQAAAPDTGLEKLPPAAGAPQNPAYVAPPAEGVGQRIKGSAEAGAALASGAVGGAAGQLYGLGKTLTGGKYGTQQGAAEGEAAGVNLANRLTYQPKTQTGQAITEGVGKALSPLQALPADAGLLGRIGEVPRGALGAAETAADINRGVASAAALPAKALTRKAISALPDLDPETKQLASDAHSIGFRLTPDQVYGNKYGKFAGELANENPLIKTNREKNQAVFNEQLVKQLGGEGDKLTRKVFSGAMKKSGGTIGDIAEKTQIPLTPSFTSALRASVGEAEKFQTSDVSRVVNSYVEEIVNKSENGILPGKALRTIDTKLGNQIRNTANGDLKYALGEVQDTLRDAMNANLSAEDRAALAAARKQYAVGKALEPLVAKAPTGDIPPASLLGALTATKAGKSTVARGAMGDLGKLADIGQKFLKSPPSSGTAERSIMQNLLTHPLGSLAFGATAAATSPLAAAYNRLGPEVTQQLINRPPVP